jgi:hypothetical protein
MTKLLNSTVTEAATEVVVTDALQEVEDCPLVPVVVTQVVTVTWKEAVAVIE